MDSKKLVDRIMLAMQDKKAKDINIIDIHSITIIADYFVICSGTSTTHIKAIADEIEEKLTEMGVEPYHKEGYDTARWVLLDYGDVVVHVFYHEDREFYNLERLWSDGEMTCIR
ncbi:ribosome silencing factor [Ruminiclostridium herbifermentans]|uniref:Ribosomal silencing factor RsfS n=1 Tax=Ruminiclostridium herbifermentans TaxID=2488810 RepID=A0A4U7JDL7_9FIRM|nr:ribosome silencing factor [Ruminiclostridium herbifermentans]QNU65866.1 ribosome silencing factor [Ruminiclostridium herbifermentans]